MESHDLKSMPGPQPIHALIAGRVAMLDVDVQNSQVFGLADKVRDAGLHQVADNYDIEVAKILPNIRTLMDKCRGAGIEVVHLRCASYTGDGKDCSRLFRSIDGPAGGAQSSADLHEAVASQGNEIVLSKVSSSAFNGSDLDFLLRRLGIDTLIVPGLVTAGCVEGTIRGAADRGYKVFVVEDACADWTLRHHAVSLHILGKWFATVVDTPMMLRLIDIFMHHNDKRCDESAPVRRTIDTVRPSQSGSATGSVSKPPDLRKVGKTIPSVPLVSPTAALLLIDMQRLTCDPQVGLGARMRSAGLHEVLNRYYGEVAK